MLIVTDALNLREVLHKFPDIIVYNYTSPLEGFPVLRLRPMREELMNINDGRFDYSYEEYIFKNDQTFLEMMKIIMPLYMNQNVCLLIKQGEPFTSMAESLLKIIQHRYGYNGILINDPYDLSMIDEEFDESDFSTPGLSMLDADKERYSYLMEYSRMKSEGFI